jgi:ribosomal protein L7/L12
MDISYYISENIDTQFDLAASINADIDDLDEQIAKLQDRRHGKCVTLASCIATVLCLVTVDHLRHVGNKHKVPLIKLYRKAYGGGLKEAKDAIESYVEVGELE